MKVHFIYQDKMISTKLNRGVKIKDLLYNLKNSPQLKNLIKPDQEIKLFNENLISEEEEDIIQINENLEKKFYIICKKNYNEKKKTKLDLEETISQVTDAKTKLKKKATDQTQKSNLLQDKLQLIQQLANQLPTNLNIPGMQNRANEINHFTNLLRTMINQDILGGQPQLQVSSNVSRPAQVQPDENALRQLQEMGFPEENCRRALVLARNNVSRATDLLINDQLDYIPSVSVR
jgi:hypothetical protein